MAQEARRIVVSGAGLAGSLAALMLARRGFEVTVYEKRTDMRVVPQSAGRSINLALSTRGIDALERAGIMDRIEPLLLPMPGRMLHDRQGELKFQAYSANPEELNYSISRGGLNQVLMNEAEATGRVEILFEHEVTGADFGARDLQVAGPDGQINVHDAVLIAADGAGSPVRRAMVEQVGIHASEDMLDHGYKELHIPPAEGGGFRIEARALHIWPRGGYMTIALPNLDGSFTVTLFLPREGDPGFDRLTDARAVVDFFERDFSDLTPLLPTLTDDFFGNPTGHLGTIRCDPWHVEGAALLIGDAAHAVVPFHGQGMNCAFEDCLELDDLVATHGSDWGRVFAALSERRKPNADAIADMALDNYIEMRDSVRDPRFHLRKEVEFALERRHPERFIPRYSMVMFHPEIPYAEAQMRGARQREVVDRHIEGCGTLEDVDLEAIERELAG